MPLFKSNKSKLTLEEELIQIWAKADENIAKSRAKFDIENAKVDEKKAQFEEKMDRKQHHVDSENKHIIPVRLSAEHIAEIRAITDARMIDLRELTDLNLANTAFLKAELHGVEPDEYSRLKIEQHLTEEKKQNLLKTDSHHTLKTLIKEIEILLQYAVDEAKVTLNREEIAQRNAHIVLGKERIAQIDAHNKAVLMEIAEEISDIRTEHRGQRQQIRNRRN